MRKICGLNNAISSSVLIIFFFTLSVYCFYNQRWQQLFLFDKINSSAGSNRLPYGGQVVTFFHLVGVLASVKYFRKCASDTVI